MISGSAKGRTLKGPPHRRGNPQAAVRPSSDLVRGAVFDALAALGCDLSHVLDLYAGTGALGVEALSRGAGQATFVERDRSMCDIIRENLRATGLAERATVVSATVEQAAKRLDGTFTLVLADPPYADDRALAALDALARSALLDGEATIVLEHSARVEPRGMLGPFSLARVLRHGDSAVSIYLSASGEAEKR